MRIKILSVMAALLLVTACETTDGLGGSSSSSGGKYGSGRPGVESGSLRNPNAKPGSVEDFTDNVGNVVNFGFDSYELDNDSRATLDSQAEWLKSYDSVSITVEGHCDERGTREYNLALGERRASAVKSYLIASGVPASRVDTVSYGKERPEVAGSNEAAWAENRRGVSTIR